MSQSSGSRRSSLTFFSAGSDVTEDQSHHTHIAEITSRGEEHIERYGGDDIHDPSPKELHVGPSSIPSESTVDVNMVTWDGPNDPTNPQNWSIKYKWLVTVVCIIMTVNVYV